MNREIKFRVFDKVEQKYIYDPVELELLLLELNITVSKPVIGFAPEYFERFVFEQYTGLKDRNGVEIYEGDIVYDDNFGYKYEVIFNPRNASFALKSFDCYKYFDDDVSVSDLTITGNIHTKTDSNVQS